VTLQALRSRRMAMNKGGSSEDPGSGGRDSKPVAPSNPPEDADTDAQTRVIPIGIPGSEEAFQELKRRARLPDPSKDSDTTQVDGEEEKI
jgi:hypothetical protein